MGPTITYHHEETGCFFLLVLRMSRARIDDVTFPIALSNDFDEQRLRILKFMKTLKYLKFKLSLFNQLLTPLSTTNVVEVLRRHKSTSRVMSAQSLAFQKQIYTKIQSIGDR